MWIQVTTIGDLLDARAETSTRDALVMPEARLTYPELSSASDRFAAALVGLGVRAGDKVAILMPNSVDYVCALLGIVKLGAVAVPINGRFKVHECGHVVEHSDATVLLVAADPHGTDYAALVGDVLAELGDRGPRTVVGLTGDTPGFLSRADFEAAAESVDVAEVKRLQARVRVRDTALLMYTSGTTARPKGCLLTHEALVRQATMVAHTRFELTETDAFWDPLPLFHCGGIVPMLGCFSAGATYCHAGHFEPAGALKMIAEEHCTVLYPAFETIWLAVLDHPDFASTDLSAVRLLQNICTPERLAQFEARMPWARQVSSYGSTECATNLTLPLASDPYEVRMRTLGRPVEGMEIRIVDPETGADLGEGVMGELCFRGYSAFDGYYKDPEQTALTIDAQHWVHTGDRAMTDAQGNLVYGGRIKDMLKVGGENVAAIEVEDYLARHPGVGIVQVVPAPDERYGEVPTAFIQLSPGATLTEQDVVDYCLGSIATYKVPRYVRFVTEWPMSGTKIQKFVLRDRIAAELAASGITEAPRLTSAR
ncbi:AMP-binding protein [Actinophytocola oryzae]|uniref:Fatty-acyl-CoA synthase n=1 Tax=Actinophytocola oryzae TaxID=502181 RepID=A0A4V3FUR3_9PSEU|nr:AMP-binding protein [Actinophytocola oryzae]TDV56231.1 fatty-acyl-CoA synthase [Actinophytocola oryzae]